MRTYQSQIKEIEKGIESLMSSLPQTLESIPGVGPVFAAGIVAEIGQIERFTDETRMPNTRPILEEISVWSLYCRKHFINSIRESVSTLLLS